MSFLADEISSREGLDSITDHSLSNKLLLRNDERRNRHIKSKFNIVKNSMQLEIPQNINTIELDRFVHLRSNDEFNKLRRNYMNEIDKYFEENANVSYNHLNNDILNISKAIKSLMIGFLGASFSIIVLSCVGVELETAFSIGAIPAVGQEVISIANDQQGIAKSVRQLRNKLMAKKFLAILNRL